MRLRSAFLSYDENDQLSLCRGKYSHDKLICLSGFSTDGMRLHSTAWFSGPRLLSATRSWDSADAGNACGALFKLTGGSA